MLKNLILTTFAFAAAALLGAAAPVPVSAPAEAGPPIQAFGPSADALAATMAASGRVRELGTPDPVEGALIEAPASGERTVSDRDGRFTLAAAVGLPLYLRVSAPGYAPLKRTVTAKAWEGGLSLNLKRTAMKSREIVIRGRRDKPEVSRTSMRAEELKHVPGSGGDPLRALQSLPGVVSANDFSGQLAVRGGGPNDNLYFLDGIPWPVPFHFGGFVSTVSPDLLSGVDMYAAAFPVAFGNADGAILDAHTRPGRKDRLHLKTQLDIIEGGLLAEGPLGLWNGSWTLSGRRSWFDLVLPHFIDVGSTALPRYWDLGASLELNPTAKSRIRALVLVTDDQLALEVKPDALGDSRAAGEFRYRNAYTSSGLTWTDTSLDRLTSTLSLYYYQVTNETVLGPVHFSYFPNTWGLKEDARVDAGSTLGISHKVGLGFQFERLEFNYFALLPRAIGTNGPISFGDLQATTYTAQAWRRGAFLEDRLGLRPDLSLTLGVRYDKTDRVATDSTLPRASLEWAWDSMTTWRAAWGMYSQDPNLFQLDPVFGNPALDPQRCEHVVLGWERRFNPTLMGRVEGYVKTYTHSVVSVPGPRRDANEGEGSARGVELLLRQELTDRLFGWLTYSYTKSERRNGLDGDWQLYQYDQPHVATLVASYDLTPQFSLGTKLRYNSGPLYTPLVGRYQDADGVWHGIDGSPEYSQRLPDYLRWDLRVEYKWVYPDWSLSIYGEVLNVLGRENPAGVNYARDYSDWDHPKTVNNFPRFPLVGLEAAY